MQDDFRKVNPLIPERLQDGTPSAPVETSPALAHRYSEFRSLDPRVVGLWRVTHMIFFAVLLLSSLIGAGISWIQSPQSAGFAIAGWLALVVLFTWISLWRPPRLYRAWGYRIDDRVLETRSGLIVKVSRLLPLSRLQHVDIHRGPIERAFGLSSLILHTAGTHEAAITIPGLDPAEAAALRDKLVDVVGDDGV